MFKKGSRGHTNNARRGAAFNCARLSSPLQPTKLRKFLLIQAIAIAFFAAMKTYAAAQIGWQEIADILRTEQFQITRHVSAIPQKTLENAGMIRQGEQLVTLLADSGKEFNAGDLIKKGQPSRKLVFCGISQNYMVICYLKGGRGLSRNFLVIRNEGRTSRVIFQAILFETCDNLDEIEGCLARGKFLAFQQNQHL